MATLTNDSRDYVTASLDAEFAADSIAAIFMLLGIQRGKYWANPNIGNRFYLLQRSKDVPRMLLLCKQYADEALADLVPGRFKSIVVTTKKTMRSRIDLHIEATHLTGKKQTILYQVEVGG
jgi:phage gp46-like protein